MNAPRQRLYWRLTLPLGLSLLAATLLAWWLASRLLSDALEARLQGQLDATADLLAEQGLPFTPELLERVAGLLGFGVVLFGPAGQVALITGPVRAPLSAVLEQAARDWREAPGRAPGTTLRAGGTRYRATLRALPAGRDPRYASLLVLASLADLERASARTAGWLGGAAAAGLLLLAWVGHRLAHGITGPVAELAGLAARVAAGERAARVPVHRDDEIGQLAAALNRMAERLGDYEAEVAATSRQAALGQLTAQVAHEVRNPLTALKLQLELLGEQVDAERRTTVAGLLDEVRRLELIVTSHLALGRDAPLAPCPTDLNALLHAVAELLRPQLAHRHVALELALADGLPELALDPDRLRQVLLNLLVNAAEALPDGGTVRLGSAAGADAVTVTVEDDGPGIDPALAGRLFEASVSGKPGGLGVGLHLSREIVAAHGGSLAADRSPELGGARFTLALPRSGASA